MSYAVQQFFNNGGSQAYVVRVPKNDAVAGKITLKDGDQVSSKQALTVTALSKGAWANNVIVDVDYGAVGSDAKAFNLTITDRSTNTTEVFSNVTMDSTKTNYVVAVVNHADNGSQLVSVAVPDATAGRPMETGTVGGTSTSLRSRTIRPIRSKSAATCRRAPSIMWTAPSSHQETRSRPRLRGSVDFLKPR